MNKQHYVIALLVILVGIVSGMSHNDELAMQAYNCEMVAEGYWPEQAFEYCW